MKRKSYIAILLAALSITADLHSQTTSGSCCGGAKLEQNQSCCHNVAFVPADDKACCNDLDTYNPSLRPGAFSTGVAATDYLKSKISDYLSKIPGVGSITVSEGSASFTKTVSDCCPDDKSKPPVKDGKKGAQGTGSLKASVKNIPVWPVPPLGTKEKKFSLLGNDFDVMVNIGSFIDIDVGPSATLGFLQDGCKDDKPCAYGSVSLTTDFTLAIKFEAILCYKLWFQSKEECVEANLQPVAASISFGAQATYNKDGDCTKGLEGSAVIGKVSVKGNFSIAGGTKELEYWSWDGYKG